METTETASLRAHPSVKLANVAVDSFASHLSLTDVPPMQTQPPIKQTDGHEAVGFSSKNLVKDYQGELARAVAPIQHDLAAFEEFIKAELRHENTYIAQMLSYVSELGGKRLRPSLLLLSAKAFGTTGEEAIRLAASVELVHTATLVHDDVLDGALTRRHRTTVHHQWNIPSAILIGDWLFTHAYRLANLGTSTTPGVWIADAAKKVCEGEIIQGQSARNFLTTEHEYFQMLDAKTGALCGVSCALGAWSAKADAELCQKMYEFGTKLGTAFQVFDDWLDVWGDASRAGKTLGTDLANFKPTLPSIRALAQLPSTARVALVADLNRGDQSALAELTRLVRTPQISASVRQTAVNLIQDACGILDSFEHNEAVYSLRILAENAVNRRS